jgi:hypothetical protein
MCDGTAQERWERGEAPPTCAAMEIEYDRASSPGESGGSGRERGRRGWVGYLLGLEWCGGWCGVV